MLSLVLFFLLISSGSVFAAVRYSRRYEETVPLTIFCSVEVVFLFGLLDNLKLGFWVLCILAVMLYGLSVAQIMRERNIREICGCLFTPAFFLFLALLVFYAFIIVGRTACVGDEFSYWAISVKKMWYLNAFPGESQINTAFVEYPPGMQTFQYILQALNGEFSEWRLNFAHMAYIFALFLPFLKGLRRRIFPILFIIALIFSSGTILYPDALNNLMIDLALGVTFAYGISVLYSMDEEKSPYSIFAVLNAVMAANMAVLIKSSGRLFAVIILLSLLVCVALFYWKDLFCQIRQKGKRLCGYAAICLTPLLTAGLWKLKYMTYAARRAPEFDTGNYNLYEFLMILLGKTDGGWRGEVKGNFISFMCSEKMQVGFLSLTNLQLFLLLTAVLLLICAVLQKSGFPKHRKCAVLVMIICAFVYWLGLMCSYMYIFDQSGGTTLACLQRYLNIYHAGMLMSILFMLLKGYNDFQWDSSVFCVVMLVLLTFPSHQHVAAAVSRKNVQDSISNAAYLQVLTDQLPKLEPLPSGLPEDSYRQGTVLLVRREGMPHIPVNQFQYMLYPYYYVPWECSYGSQPLFDGDYYTQIFTAQEFCEHVYSLGVTYIAVNYPDEDFINQYSGLFNAPLESGQVYRVPEKKDGPFELVNFSLGG